MNGHIQDFAHKLNLREEKQKKTKQNKNKMNTAAAGQHIVQNDPGGSEGF